MIRCCGGSAPASPTKAVAALRLHQPSVAHSLRSNRASDRWPAPTKAASPTLVSKKMHLVGKSVIDVVVHTKATTYPPNKMQLKAILNRVEKQKGFVYHAIFWSDDRTRCSFRFDLTREVDLFAVAVVAKVPAMTRSPSDDLSLCRCGQFQCSFFTGCDASTVLAVASRSRKCPGPTASINRLSVTVSSWPLGPSGSAGRRPR